jgi:hypothetical protein
MSLRAPGELEATAAECEELIAIFFKSVETAVRNKKG